MSEFVPNVDLEQISTENKKEKDSKITENIKNIGEIFRLHPELTAIGTQEQYLDYLQSIFPESKYKNILWHYSDAEFREEGFKPVKPNFDTLNSIEGVYNFSTNQKFVTRYGKNHYPVVIDTKHPLMHESSGEYVDDMDRPLSEDLFRIGKQKTDNPFAPRYDENLKDTDAVINNITGEEYRENPNTGQELGVPKQTVVSVFDSSQIHILGSRADVFGFTKFLKK